ncbi:unnamed protein product [Urochloa humidicola]
MEAGKIGGLTARGKGKAPGPPPPPPSRDEANGGHLRGQRSVWPRGRAFLVALVAMIAAALYLLFADALGAPPPSAEWQLAAYVVWVIGLNMLVWLMN